MDPKHAELLLEVCLELPLVLFSFAVLCSVVAKVRSGAATFASDFFLLYIVQAVTDLTDYFVVSCGGTEPGWAYLVVPGYVLVVFFFKFLSDFRLTFGFDLKAQGWRTPGSSFQNIA